MTARLTVTLALAALLTASSCVDVPPIGPPVPTKVEETHSTRADAPVPHDHVPALYVLDKVNAFYDSAWNKLVFAISVGVMLVVGFLGTIGVIMPLLTRRRQSKTFDRAKDDLETKIDNLAAKAEKDVRAAQDQMLAQVEDAMNESKKESKAALGELADKTRKMMAAVEFRQLWRLFNLQRQQGQDPVTAIFTGTAAIHAGLVAGESSRLDVFLTIYLRFINELDQKAYLAASDIAIQTLEHVIAALTTPQISEGTQGLVEELQKAVDEARMSGPAEGTDSEG